MLNGKSATLVIALLIGALLGGGGGYLVLGQKVITEGEFQTRVDQAVDDAMGELAVRIRSLDEMKGSLGQMQQDMAAVKAQMEMLREQMNRLEAKIDGHIRQWPEPGTNSGTGGAGSVVPGRERLRASVP